MTAPSKLYRAALFRHKSFGLLLALLVLSMVICSMLADRLDLVGLAAAVAVGAYVRLRFRYMLFGAESMVYLSWLRRHTVRYSEIKRIRHASELPWPTNRIHGPTEFRIETDKNSFWVSFLWFEQDAYRAFQKLSAGAR